MDNLNRIKHLYARVGFGLSVANLKQIKGTTVKHAVESLFQSSAIATPLKVIPTNISYQQAAKTDSLSKKMFMQQQRQLERDLNIAWVTQMSATDAQLREKMTLFWHNHFACRTQNAFYAQQLNNIHRIHALGNFKTLLIEVSKSPAMLQFLNNQQNKKDHPNENFARELMELFTIGRGSYTEQDVKESARAFTGWGFNNDGEFIERRVFHDDGQKMFLGKSGALTGEDIINTLLEKKETARFLSTKLYKYLVNEVPDAANTSAMANVFYSSGYDISKLLNFVFNADWFYFAKNTGNLIKSPVDLIVGLNRQFYIDYKNPDVLIQFERALGQVLFYPPNVAGWPGGKSWIDSSSLMFRLKIPSTVLNDGLIDFKGKADPEDEAFLAINVNKRKAVNTQVQSQPDWDKFLAGIPTATTKATIASAILAPVLNNNIMAIVNRNTDVRSMVIELASTPEYQLC